MSIHDPATGTFPTRSASRCSRLLLALTVCSSATAWAEPATENVRLDYAQTGLQEEAEERIARGGELLTPGPDGRLALYNPVDGTVLVLDALEITQRIEVGVASDLSWTTDGHLLVLDGPTRTLARYSGGDPDSVFALPDLVPQGTRLHVEGDRIHGRDLFGNLHRIAAATPRGLEPADGPALVQHGTGVQWDAERRELRALDRTVALPDALQASGQLLGDRWLVVDEVVGDSPIRVTRYAIDLLGDARVPLPLAGRVYVPQRDVAVDAQGRLLYLDPQVDGLHLWRVTP